mgnify:CR=1 FL=1
MFDELVNEISKDILSHEQRKRLRTSDEQHRFKYTVRYILTDLWKASKSIPIRECLVNLRSGSYSETPERPSSSTPARAHARTGSRQDSRPDYPPSAPTHLTTN